MDKGHLRVKTDQPAVTRLKILNPPHPRYPFPHNFCDVLILSAVPFRVRMSVRVIPYTVQDGGWEENCFHFFLYSSFRMK